MGHHSPSWVNGQWSPIFQSNHRDPNSVGTGVWVGVQQYAFSKAALMILCDGPKNCLQDTSDTPSKDPCLLTRSLGWTLVTGKWQDVSSQLGYRRLGFHLAGWSGLASDVRGQPLTYSQPRSEDLSLTTQRQGILLTITGYAWKLSPTHWTLSWDNLTTPCGSLGKDPENSAENCSAELCRFPGGRNRDNNYVV